jgi:hypothetical protein
MECKIKIGINYEPKWFERRYTQGTYSAKGVMHDEETVWLQQAMLGTPKRRTRAVLVTPVAITAVLAVIYLITYI